MLTSMSFISEFNKPITVHCPMMCFLCTFPEHTACHCFIWLIASCTWLQLLVSLCFTLLEISFCCVLFYFITLSACKSPDYTVPQYIQSKSTKRSSLFLALFGSRLCQNHNARLAGGHAIFCRSLWHNVNTAGFAYLTKFTAISLTFSLY